MQSVECDFYKRYDIVLMARLLLSWKPIVNCKEERRRFRDVKSVKQYRLGC